MMKILNKTALILLLLSTGTLAQPGPGREPEALPRATITGQVADADLGTPLEYVNIILFSPRDSQQVTGTITDRNGRFELTGLRPGRYYLELSFIGYRTKTVSDIRLAPGERHDLGRLNLSQTALAMPEVEATAERPAVSFKIDKKVIEVAGRPLAAAGTAVDVLEHAPSVKVDVEGNVTLRGSTNFRVLVDGRPSPLDPSEALQQIPSSIIENIEIITNPSARFDPEGISGIINVILKKQRLSGFSSITNLRGSSDGGYGGDFLLGYRKGSANIFLGADYNRRRFPAKRTLERWTRRNDTLTYLSATGTSTREGQPYGLRTGAELRLGPADRLSLNGYCGQRSHSGGGQTWYAESIRPGTGSFQFQNVDSSTRRGFFYSLNLSHSHSFGTNRHDLSGEFAINGGNGTDDEKSELRDSTGVLVSGRRTSETGPRRMLQLKLDYTRPLKNEGRFEAGYQSRFNRSRESRSLWEFVPDSGSYQFRPEFSDTALFGDDVHALYTIYAGKLLRLGFQTGLRAELTDRKIELQAQESLFRLKRWDLFPTLHLSYQLPAGQELMASWTRRIERPRGWDLAPFLSWIDAYNVRQGNPSLLPELSDACELGYQLPSGPNRLSFDCFYRVTHNKIERVESLYHQKNVILHTVANVGTDRSIGAELLFDLRPWRWLGLTLTTDAFHYRLTTPDTTRASLNWNSSLTTELNLPTNTRLQLTVRYSSPSVSAQGKEAATLMTDAAIRQQLLRRELTLTLRARDLFGTGRHEFTTETPDLSSHTSFSRRSPMVSLSLSWNFNNFKVERRQPEEEFEENGTTD